LVPKYFSDDKYLKQLPLTLYNRNHITATGYSKVSRGLRFPLEIPGLCTRKECSGDSSLGQWRSRYTIHAGRHSNGKAFRYLKRVIVTPAVYQLFTPLERSLKYWHWADITFYTKLYSVAESYVFVKQSDHLCYCTLASHLYRYEDRDPLYRRYGTNLPNSLN
jgi:hypothetical protein